MIPPSGWNHRRNLINGIIFCKSGVLLRTLKENYLEPSQIIQDLGAKDLETRLAATEACAKSPDIAKTAIIPLCHLTADVNEEVAQWAAAALEELGPPASEELDALVALFTAEEATAYWAVTLVGRLQPTDLAIPKQLAQLVEKETTPQEVQNRAIWAIGQIGLNSPDIQAVLEKASHSPNPRTARLASKALGNL